MSSSDVLRKLGLSRNMLEEAEAILQEQGLESLVELRHRWANARDGRWSRLPLPKMVKEDLMSYFEEEMGVSYGKMPVPPKELCTPAGPGFTMSTLGGQGLGAWRAQ
ncbi:unnamed protein product [Effrenium voratum]|nr:unnamed protein product [Effrenium voratum]